MSVHDGDPARGARVELALAAAERGDAPVALGILAGMSDAERAEHSKVVLAMLEQADPVRMAAVAATYRAGER